MFGAQYAFYLELELTQRSSVSAIGSVAYAQPRRMNAISQDVQFWTENTSVDRASTLYFTDMSMGADIAADALDAYASGDFNGYQQSTVGLIETNAVSFLAKSAGVPSAMASKAGDAWGLYIGFVAQAPSSCH